MNNKTHTLVLIITFSILVGTYANFYAKNNAVTPAKDISTFEECAAAGYPIMESYPEKCAVPGGSTYTRVTTDESPTPIALTGIYTCLPKVDTGGPITLECAFGLKAKDSYYSLDMSAILSDNYPTLYGNETITVEGTLVPKAMLSADRWKTYDVVGVISVDKIVREN